MTKFIDNTAAQLSSLSSEMKKVTEAKSTLAAAKDTPQNSQRSDVTEETEVSSVISLLCENSTTYAKVIGSNFRPPGNSGVNSRLTTGFQPVGTSALQSKLVNMLKKSTEKESPKQKRQNVFHGNSKQGQSAETFLAADVTLVASGLGLGVEEQDLVDFLKTKDIKTVRVECITRKELIYENKVKSKIMKVVVKASDHEKAMNPDIWPFRVGVRYFRAESWKSGGHRHSSQEAVPTGLPSSASQGHRTVGQSQVAANGQTKETGGGAWTRTQTYQ